MIRRMIARLKAYLAKRWGLVDPNFIIVNVEIPVHGDIYLRELVVNASLAYLIENPHDLRMLHPETGPKVWIELPLKGVEYNKPPLTNWTDDPEGRAGFPFTEPED